MGTPNQQLESALVQFASQHSVTSDQAAQLRAVLMADASLLGRLNQDAASGQLNGFNVQSPGGAPCLTGTYDKQAGVVTIPASSLQPTGTTPSVDLKAVVQIQEMSLRFAHSTYQDAAKTTHAVTQNMVDNLQSTLNGSPVLAAEMKTAVTITPPDKQAHLEHFAVLDPGFTAGATYDGSHKTVICQRSACKRVRQTTRKVSLTSVI